MRDIVEHIAPFVSAPPRCPEWQPALQLDKTGSVTDRSRRARVFISYKRNSAVDEKIAEELFRAINQQHDVFIDKTMLIGTDWAACIEAKIHEADFLITLLSEQSINSEMVKGEIEKAHFFGKEQDGRPAILPVRLAYEEPFPYSLSPYLNPLQWAWWGSDNDTPRLIDELLKAISGGQLAPFTEREITSHVGSNRELIPQPLPAASLESPEGTMDPQSEFYIVRQKDLIALEAIMRKGVTMPIKAPRQMGKSSLLLRVINAAANEGKRIALLDFQLFDQEALASADRFYHQFCVWLTAELELENRVAEFWDKDLGNNQRCTRYLGMHVLKEIGGPLVLAMDEVERVFDTSFRSDFFSMLRSWHNKRSREPIWKQLDIVLVTSTEPYQLIDNLNQSPFNVGEVIELDDFTAAEVKKLNERHGGPLTAAEEVRLMELLRGHPYLVRRALYLVASRRISVPELFTQATDERGPFGDHLRYHLFRMHDKQDLVRGMCEVIRHNTCSDDRIFFRLRGAGLVRREAGVVVPRCKLYADYFREHLHA